MKILCDDHRTTCCGPLLFAAYSKGEAKLYLVPNTSSDITHFRNGQHYSQIDEQTRLTHSQNVLKFLYNKKNNLILLCVICGAVHNSHSSYFVFDFKVGTESFQTHLAITNIIKIFVMCV